MALKEIDPADLTLNPFELIGHEWGLVTAGDEQGFNTMTVSWGGMGVLWGKNVVTVYIRPQRYTKQFVDAADRFTLSFYAPEHKGALGVLGTKSGRDGDKVAEVGFTPLFLDGTTAFEETRLIFVCRKLYASRFTPEQFIDATINDREYSDNSHHTMYIGEIEHVYTAE